MNSRRSEEKKLERLCNVFDGECDSPLSLSVTDADFNAAADGWEAWMDPEASVEEEEVNEGHRHAHAHDVPLVTKKAKLSA